MGQQGPHRPGDRVPRLVLPAGDRELDVGPDVVDRHPGPDHHRQQAVVGLGLQPCSGPLGHRGQPLVDGGVDLGHRPQAPGLDVGVAGVVGHPVDHRLAPTVEIGVADLGQTAQHLEGLAADRGGVRRHQVGAAAGLEVVEHPVGQALEDLGPDRLDPAGGDGRVVHEPLPPVLLAVGAHHVLAHQDVHQPAGLVGGEDRHVLLTGVDVVPPGQQGGSQLGHEADRGLGPHAGQGGIGIVPEIRRVDVNDRGGRHGGSLAPLGPAGHAYVVRTRAGSKPDPDDEPVLGQADGAFRAVGPRRAGRDRHRRRRVHRPLRPQHGQALRRHLLHRPRPGRRQPRLRLPADRRHGDGAGLGLRLRQLEPGLRRLPPRARPVDPPGGGLGRPDGHRVVRRRERGRPHAGGPGAALDPAPPGRSRPGAGAGRAGRLRAGVLPLRRQLPGGRSGRVLGCRVGAGRLVQRGLPPPPRGPGRALRRGRAAGAGPVGHPGRDVEGRDRGGVSTSSTSATPKCSTWPIGTRC